MRVTATLLWGILAANFGIALTGCGDIAVEQPKDEQKAGEEQEAGKHEETSKESGPDGKAAEPEEISKDNGISDDGVTVSVDVEVTVTIDGEDRELGIPRYTPVYRSWPAAVEHAPEGYRLATRSEVLALIDAGTLEELGADKAVLWTATERESDDVAYMIDCASGRVAPMGKTMTLAAVYVRDDK